MLGYLHKIGLVVGSTAGYQRCDKDRTDGISHFRPPHPFSPFFLAHLLQCTSQLTSKKEEQRKQQQSGNNHPTQNTRSNGMAAIGACSSADHKRNHPKNECERSHDHSAKRNLPASMAASR